MLKFDTKMKKSWLILATLFIALYINALEEFTAVGIATQSIGVSLAGCYPGWAIFLIRSIRGNEKQSLKPPYKITELGVWGYVWRALVVIYLGMFPLAIGTAMISGGKLPEASIQSYILSIPLMLLISVILSWLLFSGDRIGQLQRVATRLKGKSR
jgi:hypothetical protein